MSDRVLDGARTGTAEVLNEDGSRGREHRRADIAHQSRVASSGEGCLQSSYTLETVINSSIQWTGRGQWDSHIDFGPHGSEHWRVTKRVLHTSQVCCRSDVLSRGEAEAPVSQG